MELAHRDWPIAAVLTVIRGGTFSYVIPFISLTSDHPVQRTRTITHDHHADLNGRKVMMKSPLEERSLSGSRKTRRLKLLPIF